MNNKKLGTAFEREMCSLLMQRGYWVHFITPDATGAQPFDLIAVKDGKAWAIDCKTCSKPVFSVNRLEWNQHFAFKLWMAKGNTTPLLAVKHKDTVYMIDYLDLCLRKKIQLENNPEFSEWEEDQ
jgi:Holliday junction resolvase